MGREVDEFLQEYIRQWTINPKTVDGLLLEQGKQHLLHALQSENWPFQVVQSGLDLYFLSGDKAAIVDLLSSYLSRSVSVAHEAWARWHLTDNLAMLRRCEEAVQSQKDFLTWAKYILPHSNDWMLWGDWPWSTLLAHRTQPTPAEECLLIRVMSDATQALCWLVTDKIDEWLDIYREIMSQVPPTPMNRADRRYYIRTAALLMAEAQRGQEALKLATQLHDLSMEDLTWGEAFETRIDAIDMRIEALRILQNIPELRQAGMEITRLLVDHTIDTEDDTKVLRTLYHNTAWALYRAQQYALAIPLFEQAIDLKIPSNHTYLWLAASLWATTKDRSRVLSLLKQASSRQRGHWQPLQKTPEFEDVLTDDEFLNIFRTDR